MTWEEANIYCQEIENGTLVQIWNQLQLDFIRMELGFLYDHVQVPFWWTSGTDAGKEGVWRWASSLAPVQDFLWNPSGFHEPNGGLNENCLCLRHDRDFFGGDITCSRSVETGIICERK